MIEVVSFDYFPLTDYFDFGFTATEPWSDKFELLRYETINFIENMGSIILFIWIGFVYLLLVALVSFLRRRLNWKHKYFDSMKAWYSSLEFMQGTFFEILVCVSVSMKTFGFFDYLNPADKFSIANHLLVLVLTVLFMGMITYFTLFRLPKLAALYEYEHRIKKKKNID